MRFRKLSVLIEAAILALLALAAAAATDSIDANPTRIESYVVNTTIESRFARTHIVVDFVNERNCSAVRGFTFQLPLNARVTDLIMSSPNGCTLNGAVREQYRAETDFFVSASRGRPAALLTAHDSTNYAVQASLPPLGRVRVDFTYEELLYRKSHQVRFQIPIFPGFPVESLVMDITVKEPQTGVTAFGVDDVEVGGINIIQTENMVTAHYEREALTSGDALPRLLRGYYDSGPVPANGLLIPDQSGSCLVHLFNPTSFFESSGSLPRDIVFVIDVSGSMHGTKLEDAKAAFAAIIEKLTDEDFFTVHSFSGSGTEDSWGPCRATSDSKHDASEFVQLLEIGGGTNINEAYLDGIEQVKTMQTNRRTYLSQHAVPIVMMLSDGKASVGIISSVQISRNVRNANENTQAKIYALAFGSAADLDLLTGISIQNGGVSARIHEGYGDAASQMESFYVEELGTLFMSDVNVTFDGTIDIESHTQSQYSLFPDGAEIAVRAKTNQHSMTDYSNNQVRTLRATTTANTMQGISTWQTDLQVDVTSIRDSTRSECLRSFAHAKITEILMFRDAARSLGGELDDYAANFLVGNDIPGEAQVRSRSSNLVADAEARALELALEAGVVWPGLTALVTVSNPTCENRNNAGTELCHDGDFISSSGYDDIENDDSFPIPAPPPPTPAQLIPAGPPPPPPSPSTPYHGSSSAGGSANGNVGILSLMQGAMNATQPAPPPPTPSPLATPAPSAGQPKFRSCPSIPYHRSNPGSRPTSGNTAMMQDIIPEMGEASFYESGAQCLHWMNSLILASFMWLFL